jgi:Fe-Mn family superoxide dismutase
VDPFEIPQKPESTRLFDMAAQVWNHTFFWNSLKPDGGGMPEGDISDVIRINYGTFERFRETARRRALSIFGSGWFWLCLRGDALYTIGGRNAAMPLVYGLTPVLTIDMWEHAYYLDYHNDRGKYFDAVMDNLINWDFANDNVKNAPY